MYNFLTSVAAMVFVLGVMILVHEWGHYVAAKLLGVRVEVFAIGFGPRLVGFRKGETDYRIAALPFGGYVKMAGENPLESRQGDPGEFLSHPRWHRFIIAFAGPFMNIVLAVALLTGVYMVHYEHPLFLNLPAVVGYVQPGSVVDKAGIQAGDRIVRVGNDQNPTWEDLIPKVALNAGQTIDLGVQRGNEILDKTFVVPKAVGQDPFVNPGWSPDQPNVVTAIEPNMPAAKAGVKVGDVITAIDGHPTRSMDALIHLIRESGGKPITVTVQRNHEQNDFQVTPQQTTGPDGKTVYRIGVGSDPREIDKLPFTKAFDRSLEQNKRYSFLIVELVEKMITRKVSVKQVEGPIRIGQAAGEAVRQPGWTPLLLLMAAISLNLGIFNLFPIPIMDGGVILLLGIEAIMRRDISQGVKERIYQAAFVFLILFVAVVLYNDLMKAVPGLAQRLP